MAIKDSKFNITKNINVWIYDRNVDRQRLANNFREMWRTIPLSARRIILRHWRNCDILKQHFGGQPIIEMMARKSDWKRGHTREAVAQCDIFGSKLSYCSTFAALLPDEHMQTFFAHELGHVYRLATEPEVVFTTIGDESDYRDEEATVDELITDWGFDADALDEYELENLVEFELND